MRKIRLILLFAAMATACYGQDRYDAILSAISMSSRGEYQDAVTKLTSELTVAPSPELYIQRGEIYLKESKPLSATQDFQAAENLKKGAGLYGLAKCAAMTGDATRAVSYLESYLRTTDKRSEAEIVLDESFTAINSSAEWRALWRKEWYKGYEKMQWDVQHNLATGRIDLAGEALADLQAEYPDMPVTEFCKASVAIAKGSLNEAFEILKTLTAREDVKAEYLLAMAKAQEGLGNYYEASRVYGQLISMELPDATLYLKKAEMLSRAGDNEAAVKDLKKYLSYYPEDFNGLSLLGKVFAAEGSIYDALPYLNRNVENHPGEARAFSLRGDAWFAGRTWDKAVEDYTMSLDLDPQDPAVNLNLGISLVNISKQEDACHYFRKANALGEKKAAQYISRYCIR